MDKKEIKDLKKEIIQLKEHNHDKIYIKRSSMNKFFVILLIIGLNVFNGFLFFKWIPTLMNDWSYKSGVSGGICFIIIFLINLFIIKIINKDLE